MVLKEHKAKAHGVPTGGNGENSMKESDTSSSSSHESTDFPQQAHSKVKRPERAAPPAGKEERKSSKGTSPPPQSISTQTYEELPSPKIPQKSVSTKSSFSSLQFDDIPYRKPVEMSEKAMRYARKASRNHEAKLKRSMSTHLSGLSEPWMEVMEAHNHNRHMYRSSSRQSLTSDTRSLPVSGPPSRDSSPSRSRSYWEDLRHMPLPYWDRLPTPEDYFASLEDLVVRRRKDTSRPCEMELSRLLKDAEDNNFTAEDIQVALKMCGSNNPIKWLQENWSSMIETVQTLATKYGREKGEKNQIGTISSVEATSALRANRGNVWAAVTECIEQRRKKFLELQSRGNFLKEDVLTALTANHGNLDAAYIELSKAQLEPFLVRIKSAKLDNENDPVSELGVSPSTKSEPAENNLQKRLKRNERVQKKVSSSSVDQRKEKSEDKQPLHNIKTTASTKLENSAQSEIEKASQDPEPNNILHFQTKTSSTQIRPLSTDSSSLKSSDKLEDSDEISNSSSTEESEEESDLDEYGEDILEIELDDTDADALDVSFRSSVSSKAGRKSSIQDMQSLQQLIANLNLNATKSHPAQATGTGESPHAVHVPEDPGRKLSTIEIEHLVSALTNTFTEMGNLATEINAQLVTGLQQQAKVPSSDYENTEKSNEGQDNMDEQQQQSTTGNEPLYEPVTVADSVTSSVNKKIAKYKRLVGKRENGSQNKSPDSRSSKQKMKSHSSSPGSSLQAPVASKAVQPAQNESSSIVVNDQQKQVVENGEKITKVDPEIDRDEGEYISDPDTDSDESEVGSEGHSQGSNVSGSSDDDEDVVDSLNENEKKAGDPEYEEVHVTSSSGIEIRNDGNTEKSSQSDVIATEQRIEVTVEEGIPEMPKSEREIRMERLVAEGKIETPEKAELSMQLMDMNFTEEDATQAASECTSLDTALSFLQQACDICAGKFTARQMVSMLRCTHVCCQNCAKEYFTVQIRDKTIVDCGCPFCGEPSNLVEDSDGAADYFNNLDILLKNILESRYHEMFQRKLRDWALAKTPEFKWCSKCSSGFITEPLQTRLICPDCNAVTCAVCLEQWDKFNHDHKESKIKLCDAKSKSIVDFLNENNIECPRCRFHFALARGGCMHLTCTQCRHEFCSGCSASFRMGNKCDAKLSICAKLGLHAHHPRNCLFYLRDKEPEILTKLLQDNAIPFLQANHASTLEENVDSESKSVCQVPIQKETGEGLKDDVCGKDVPDGYTNICKAHYVEYLGLLISQNHLDPISILSNDDLEIIIRRANKKHPGRPTTLGEQEFRKRLLKVIQDEIPL